MGVLKSIGGAIKKIAAPVAGFLANPAVGVGLAAAGIIGRQINARRNYKAQRDMYNLQRDHMDYQKQMQIEAWGREDNAIQRRVADLQAAGLSPTLAAGSAAGASSPINVTTPSHAPEKEFGGLEQAAIAVGLQEQMASISKTYAEKDHIKSMIDYERAKIDNLKADTQLKTNEHLLHGTRAQILDAQLSEIMSNVRANNMSIQEAHQRIAESIARELFTGVQAQKAEEEIKHIIAQTDLRRLDWDIITRDLAIVTRAGVMYKGSEQYSTILANLRNIFEENVGYRIPDRWRYTRQQRREMMGVVETRRGGSRGTY